MTANKANPAHVKEAPKQVQGETAASNNLMHFLRPFASAPL